MYTNKNEENEIRNNFEMIFRNTDQYVWFKFTKCCGYNITFPFLYNDSIQSLYRHIDILWNHSTVNMIWLENSNNNIELRQIITRGDTRTIKQFIQDNQLYRPNFGIVYNVFFDTGNYDTHLNKSINDHINNHNCKNIN